MVAPVEEGEDASSSTCTSATHFPVRSRLIITSLTRDENYVIRCFSDEGDHTETFFHPKPFLDIDYEILVVERVEWVPLEPLKKIFPEIKKKAKIVYVVHERKPPTTPLFYEFDWDTIVCFDNRYRRQWQDRFDEDKIHIIPYPTGHISKGDKKKARRELNLPLDKRIVFSYGWAPELHIFPILPSYGFLILTADEKSVAYMSDTTQQLSRYASELLQGINYLIVNTPTFDSNTEGHLTMKEALHLKEQLKIQNLILTHINHTTLTPHELEDEFNNYPDVTLAYDGLELEI